MQGNTVSVYGQGNRLEQWTAEGAAQRGIEGRTALYGREREALCKAVELNSTSDYSSSFRTSFPTQTQRYAQGYIEVTSHRQPLVNIDLIHIAIFTCSHNSHVHTSMHIFIDNVIHIFIIISFAYQHSHIHIQSHLHTKIHIFIISSKHQHSHIHSQSPPHINIHILNGNVMHTSTFIYTRTTSSTKHPHIHKTDKYSSMYSTFSMDSCKNNGCKLRKKTGFISTYLHI